jgi:CRISPR type III-associated protein (TIGR04423 family)
MQEIICEKIQSPDQIPAGIYTGYCWLSDADRPIILENEPINYKPVLNPFIIEGHLFSEQDNVSICIRHIDGQYLIHKISWPRELPADRISENGHVYLAGARFRESGITKLKFRRYWAAQPRENCEGMSVLMPGPVGFIGFEKEKDNA